MKPTPWFPITTEPVRDGDYNVRDPKTGTIGRWRWHGVPGGTGTWFIYGTGSYQTSALPKQLEWCGLTDEIWTSRDGRQLAVFEMDCEHAKNCLRQILRVKRERDVAMVHGKVDRGLWQPQGSSWERGE